MAPAEPVPDDIRCRRHDGRDWRCRRQVLAGKLLCEIHYVQGRLRNDRKKVPDSLKLVPGTRTKKKKRKRNKPATAAENGVDASDGEELRVSTGREHLDRKKKRKRGGNDDRDEADLDAIAEQEEERKRLKARELLKAFERKRKAGGATSAATTSRKKRQQPQLQTRKKKDNVGSPAERHDLDHHSGKEVTRDLPFGRMAISPAPSPAQGGKDSLGMAEKIMSAAVKLGLKPDNYRLVTRKFRSKNIERPPISTVKVLPLTKKKAKLKGTTSSALVKGKNNKCHWCTTGTSTLVKCSSCKKLFFCSNCIKQRSIDEESVKTSCPVCQGKCKCKACLSSSGTKDVVSQEMLKDLCKVSKYVSLHYLIHCVIPVLEKINEAQSIELETEAKSKGQSLSEVEVHQTENGWEKQLFCDRCNSPILDLHRSCPQCSYKLCLDCCLESRGVSELPNQKKSISHSKKQLNKGPRRTAQDVGLSCRAEEVGGCGYKTLGLKSVFPFKWTKELEISAKQTISGHELPKIYKDSLHCSICAGVSDEAAKCKELFVASRRDLSEDNVLYCPSAHDDHDIMLIHFQKHWRNFHPVIVHHVFENDSKLSWDPVAMFSHILEMDSGTCETGKRGDKGDKKCFDWYEVEFGTTELFTGSLLKAGMQERHETMKLKAKLSHVLVQKSFGDLAAKIIDSLPLQEYTNSRTGLLNLVAKSPEDVKEPKTEMVPSIYITCGSPKEVKNGDLFTELSYDPYDTVNVLAHASDVHCSADQVNLIKALIMAEQAEDAGGIIDGQSEGSRIARGQQNAILPEASVPLNSDANVLPSSETDSDACSSPSRRSSPDKTGDSVHKTDPAEPSASPPRDHSSAKPCGVQWDIFRRQDTPKLLEYIQTHKDELCSANSLSKEVVHPILDGMCFLDSVHKMRLKEEFHIEPWTFDQHLGEAVLIPAGCAYQTRNFMSCVNVAVGFISPENAVECIKLNDGLRALPKDHRAKQGMLEVEKLVIDKISRAIDEMHGESSAMPCS